MAATGLLLLVMTISTWTIAILQLPAMTKAAQDEMITYTVRSNVRNYSDYLETNLRPWAVRNLPRVSNFIRRRILCGHTQMHTEVILQFEDTMPPRPSDRAYASGNTIRMSVGFMVNYRFKDEAERLSYFRETVYQEMTHIWQFLTGYTGQNAPNRPWAIVEGMADYAAYKAGETHFLTCRPTVDDVWYQGYCITAKFLLYLAEEAGYGGVVCNVNLMMRNGYDEQTFRTILKGRAPEDLWDEYLGSFVNPPPARLVEARPNDAHTTDVAVATH